MKLNKKSFLTLFVALIIAIIGAQSVFANVYALDSKKESFTLDEAYYINGPLFSADILQFMQAFQSPDNPLEFFKSASNYTDEQIEECFYYYLAFLAPNAVGQVEFKILADIDAFVERTGSELPKDNINFQASFTNISDLSKIYPAGIVLTDAYDGFRTTARNLYYYTIENGKAPAYDNCMEILELIYQQIQQDYEAAINEEETTTPAEGN